MSNRDHNVNSTFEAIGAFWPYGQADQKFTGTLSSDAGRLTLSSAPVYSEHDIQSAAAEFFNAVNSFSPFERTESLCGFTTEGECSLLSAALIDEPGLTSVTTGQRLASETYRVWAAVMGLHLPSAHVPVIESATFQYFKLSAWLPVPFGISWGEDQRAITTANTPIELFRFRCVALDAEITCNVHAEAPVKRRRAKIKSLPTITVRPSNGRAVDWFIQNAVRVENFLTLCLGTSVMLKAVRFEAESKTGWLVHRLKGKSEKTNLQAWLRCPPTVIASALDKWLSEPEERRPVEKVVLGVLRKSSLFVETEFLSLAQALEGFDRIQTGNSSKKFRKRIEDTYDLLTPAFASELFGTKEVFARRIVQTRDYFTHLGLAPGADVLRGGGELFEFNQKLNAFVRCVMLLQLGVHEDYLREPIRYQAGRWKLR